MNVSKFSTNQSEYLVYFFLKTLDYFTDLTGTNVPQIVDLSHLRSLPPKSFGYSWLRFLEEHQLEPFSKGIRRKQLHDGLHVLTGYGVDRAGEAELQAFLYGASFFPLHILLILGLTHSIPLSDSKQIWQRLQIACRRGRQSSFNAATWQPEHLWELPLPEVQAQFNLK